MTIQASTRTAGPFTTGSAFTFSFKVFSTSDVVVYRTDTSTGVVTTLSLTTDYTVALNSNQNSNPGGTVTLVAGALPANRSVLIVSAMANTQPVDITNQSGFYPDVINDGLDRAVAQIQQLKQQADRSIRFPPTELSPSNVIPSSSNRAGKLLGFDASGNIIAGAAATAIEEGNWNPVYSPAAGSFSPMTMTVTQARYVKVGKCVTVTANIATSNVGAGTSSGNLYVSGLPFPCDGTSGCGVVAGGANWLNATSVPFSLWADTNGASRLVLLTRSTTNGATSAVQTTALAAGAAAGNNVLIFSATYWTP